MGHNDDIEKLIQSQDLTKQPPEQEPERQYYFIKKCREIVKKKSEELGRPLYACSVCMGCHKIIQLFLKTFNSQVRKIRLKFRKYGN